jgi:hypothetical protein
MPNNYILLETIALTQAAASVTFDNLPTSGYTDLKVVMSGRDSGASTRSIPRLTFNGSTTGYSSKAIYGVNGTTVGSENGASTYIDWSYVPGDSATASTFSNTEVYIPNYRSSNNKSVSIDFVAETNSGSSGILGIAAGLWSNSAAITSITFTGPNNLLANSTFSLYGIAALGTTPVLAPKATGGNIVANDGTYWYHAFLSSGNFVPQIGLTCDALVVAGGGGGGSWTGGGGGAGGLLGFNSQALAATSYNVTIGAGGTGGTYAGPARGAQGSNSQFAALTASVGGGGGGGYNGAYFAPTTGGSGGGGTTDQGGSGAQTGAAASPSGQGSAGGSYTRDSTYAAGGGGGAGAVGANNSGTSAGAGGIGTATYSSWGLATTTGQNSGGTVYYAGGGGGGSNGAGTQASGGLGGGGAGRVSFGQTPDNGTTNTGGGGGGGPTGSGTTAAIGGTGGSGIVIIRYPIAS